VDENWLHHFDPESKMQSMAWKHVSSPPPRKFRVVALAHKLIATVFWDAEVTVLIDSLEHGSTITGIYYADLIRKARAALKEKRRGKLCHGVQFHQENAPAHTSSQALAAIRNVRFELLPHQDQQLNGIRALKKCWSKCISIEGDCICFLSQLKSDKI